MEPTERVTVQDAASLLGISEGAVRKRVARGTLGAERDREGRVWVYLKTGTRGHPGGQDARQPAGLETGRELVEELRDRARYLERQLDQERDARTEERRRHDTLFQQLLQRIPELEAPASPERPPDARVSPSGAETNVGTPTAAASPETPSSRPSLWRRIFGG